MKKWKVVINQRFNLILEQENQNFLTLIKMLNRSIFKATKINGKHKNKWGNNLNYHNRKKIWIILKSNLFEDQGNLKIMHEHR